MPGFSRELEARPLAVRISEAGRKALKAQARFPAQVQAAGPPLPLRTVQSPRLATGTPRTATAERPPRSNEVRRQADDAKAEGPAKISDLFESCNSVADAETATGSRALSKSSEEQAPFVRRRRPHILPQIGPPLSEAQASAPAAKGAIPEFQSPGKMNFTAFRALCGKRSENGSPSPTPGGGIRRYVCFEEVAPSNTCVSLVRGLSPEGRPVVIKKLKRIFFGSREEEREWSRSCRALMEMEPHENLCQVLDLVEERDGFQVVMEQVEGVDLFTLLQSGGPLTAEHASRVLGDLLRGLAALHEQNLVHRDIKLQNVLAKQDFQAKIIDFDTVQNASVPSLYGATVVGSDQYIAPEAYDGHFSPASDIFAVGVLAFALCHGRFPFSHKLFDDEPGENFVGSVKMAEISARLLQAKINWAAEESANDFCQQLLQMSAEKRPTAREALQHPFLARTGEAEAEGGSGTVASL
ncbi:unnamed protein product [Effrenium voratum]|uniref:Protein kinase domain-containing protein n=1 Tax=Effrenium voratum TaxID=2562239 RepID=A0AA36ITT6_9DINO|nr:unnamed protein product [Effrenium voratum]CAJ1416433.1 unnamed protein product [Effrenium voratum]